VLIICRDRAREIDLNVKGDYLPLKAVFDEFLIHLWYKMP